MKKQRDSLKKVHTWYLGNRHTLQTGPVSIHVKYSSQPCYYYSPTLKKGGPTLKKGQLENGGLCWICVVCQSVILSAHHNFITTQYLEKKLKKFHQILCIH